MEIKRQHVTLAECDERWPQLGVMAAGIPNLEQHGIEAGDHVEVTVTLHKVEIETPEEPCPFSG